jgi:hypothetical protein
MSNENKTWDSVKADYLHQVANALSQVNHPKSKDVLEDVSAHLDRRFAQLQSDEQTWENFQAIITDMGPPSEYAELLQADKKLPIKKPSLKFIIVAVIILAAIFTALVWLPSLLRLYKNTGAQAHPQQLTNPSQQKAVKAATEAAEKWLKFVDNRDYGQSWEQAAEYFRAAVSKEQWNTAVTAARNPLGLVLSRHIRTSTYTSNLPGVPDGEYVVIQFETSFENKKSAVETITPMLDKDGSWRISGYYIN